MAIESILLVDDDLTSNFIAKTMLSHFNFANNYPTAMNGEEASQFLLNTINQSPDAILLDINMPLMDGFEFLDWYEKNGFKGTSTIFMYSSSSRPEDIERARQYTDVADYIVKPLDEFKIKRMQDIIATTAT